MSGALRNNLNTGTELVLTTTRTLTSSRASLAISMQSARVDYRDECGGTDLLSWELDPALLSL
ncbi:hypothetical protein OG612_45500 (plasmid) [Streptomyces sp. NBC_01527]|uniref:hypothetical protein n=1 Tax=Streptomyces sp. NBC_01527 TaxID=2903894 RepID=UPI00386F084C